MSKWRNACRVISFYTSALVFVLVISCALRTSSTPSSSETRQDDGAALKIQALVMSMADDYIASLGESIYLLLHSGELDSKGRWLAQSFLRNGVGASLDIAVGPNPSVSLLDLLVLTSLQTWSFEVHWIPAGIGGAGIPAVQRLKRAEAHAWGSARKTLSEDQERTLHELIGAWIVENSDRTVVSLVRFEDFTDERRISALPLRGKAKGLLKDIGEASAVIDETRLLGERLLWFAGRYPYLLGEQAELTAYRLAGQTEGVQIFGAVQSIKRLSEALAERVGTLQDDLEKQQAAFFSNLSAERAAAIDHLFQRFAQERKMLLDDLATRKSEILDLMDELNKTISVSGTLANELTGTVNAIDTVVGRFVLDPQDKGEPLRMTDVRDAAIETGRAAVHVTHLLEQVLQVLESKSWDQKISGLREPVDAIVDRIFWRGVILVSFLIVGLGLLRLVPHFFKCSEKEKQPTQR